jgi:hypothetical protein
MEMEKRSKIGQKARRLLLLEKLGVVREDVPTERYWCFQVRNSAQLPDDFLIEWTAYGCIKVDWIVAGLY